MVESWATVQDVLDLTGVTVTDADVVKAQASIDLHAARLYTDRDRIGTRDQYWLKLATAYQAAWLLSQPDAFERIEVASTGSTDGVTMTPQALTLGPYARRALKRVSWLRSRSLRVRAPGESVNRVDDNNLDGDWWPV